jgi:hypothetical protein
VGVRHASCQPQTLTRATPSASLLVP